MKPLFLIAAVSLIPLATQSQLAPAPAEIRSAATKSLTLLDTVNRRWLKRGYCYSCHNDGLFNKLHAVARRHGLPVDEALASRVARKTYGWTSIADEAIQGYYFVDPALVDGHELVALHDAGYPATLPLAAYARRLTHLQTPAGNWITSDRRPPQSNSQWSATEVSLEAIQYYLPESLSAQKREIFSKSGAMAGCRKAGIHRRSSEPGPRPGGNRSSQGIGGESIPAGVRPPRRMA